MQLRGYCAKPPSFSVNAFPKRVQPKALYILCIHQSIHNKYTQNQVYPKMSDIFDAKVHCSQCNKPTEKTIVIKNGFKLRALHCSTCNKYFYHPQDIEEQKRFQQLRNKQFQVKLRMVGNSYTISIPREIIDFREECLKDMDRDMNRMLLLSLEEPEKLSIFFNKKIQELFEK